MQPHIPVIDRQHQTYGRFTREQFRYEPTENAFYCPQGKRLRFRGIGRLPLRDTADGNSPRGLNSRSSARAICSLFHLAV